MFVDVHFIICFLALKELTHLGLVGPAFYPYKSDIRWGTLSFYGCLALIYHFDSNNYKIYANNIDPDEMALFAESYLGLHSLSVSF